MGVPFWNSGNVNPFAANRGCVELMLRQFIPYSGLSPIEHGLERGAPSSLRLQINTAQIHRTAGQSKRTIQYRDLLAQRVQ